MESPPALGIADALFPRTRKAEHGGEPVNATGALVQSLVAAAENVDEEARLAHKAWGGDRRAEGQAPQAPPAEAALA